MLNQFKWGVSHATCPARWRGGFWVITLAASILGGEDGCDSWRNTRKFANADARHRNIDYNYVPQNAATR
jgi:hypothetical protein